MSSHSIIEEEVPAKHNEENGALTLHDIPEPLLCDQIFSYAIETRLEWEDYCMVNKEINDRLTQNFVPPWPAGTKIKAGCGPGFALCQEYLFASYDRLIDRFGNTWRLPDIISKKQTQHKMVQIGDTSYLVIAFYDEGGMVQVWDLEDTDQGAIAKWTIPDQAGIAQMAFSSDGSLLAIGSSRSVEPDSGVVFLYGTSDWKLIKRLQGPAGEYQARDDDSYATLPPEGVEHLFFGCKGQLLASWGHNVRIWNLKTYNFTDNPTSSLQYDAALGVSPDGNYFANLTASDIPFGKPTVAIWKIGEAGSIENMVNHKLAIRRGYGGYEALNTLTWSPDGRWLAIGVLDPGSIYLMDPMTGAVTKHLSISARDGCYGLKIVFSHDSKLIFYGVRSHTSFKSHAIEDIPEYEVVEEDSDDQGWSDDDYTDPGDMDLGSDDESDLSDDE